MPEDPEEVRVVDMLTRLFSGLGADGKAARGMARQLWKRSAQIALERDVKQVEALDALIRLTISGSQGTVLPEHASHPGSGGDVKAEPH
jgi:hypothetical protein